MLERSESGMGFVLPLMKGSVVDADSGVCLSL
jgi:hypothetical protein